MNIQRLPEKVLQDGCVMEFDEPRFGYKAVSNGVCRLIVPSNTEVVYPDPPSNRTWNHYSLRVPKAIVDNIECEGESMAYSIVSDNFIYREGSTVVAEQFDSDVSNVSGPGIHLFAVRKRAEDWFEEHKE